MNLKNITIGQYIPGDSVIHKLDPRAKIIVIFLTIISLFFVNSFIGYILMAFFILLELFLAKVDYRYVLKGIKPLRIILMFTFFLHLFMDPGKLLFAVGPLHASYEGLMLGSKMVIRLVLLVVSTSVLTLTTSPMELTDGLESLMKPFRKIGLPAHELAMMMTIALRFIPTLIEETDKIMKAQMARGADFESGNIVKRAKSMIPILVPLFVSAFRRADDLALAMEARCYRGGDKRTRMKVLKMTSKDIYISILAIVLIAAIVIPF